MGAPRTLAEIVGRYVDAQIAVLLDAEPRLLDGRLEAVHPARVAVRRLRSTLRTFDVYKRSAADVLGAELRWFGSVLGEVRDLDVQSRRLAAALDDVAERESAVAAAALLDDEAAARSRTAWVHVGAALGSPRYARLRSLLDDWTETPPLRKRAGRPADTVVAYVDAADRILRERIGLAVRAAAEGSADGPERAHAARKAGKRHRYAAELALPVLGEPGRLLIEQRTALQDALGEQQDATVAQRFVAELADAADDPAKPALDAVLRRELQTIADAGRVLDELASRLA
ncbi:hypothetical protein GOARA_082_00560 [Gordonia araii NBRC 100433]|uniref:CHAD domain-containing protein n=1 Tax=Gordonia araii NBRC 100433 TaxID=1073574 RepID=G7H742_9ACTN|nr:CHAD domain-containing protein [Gordonia araii]NNG97663.1 CHAD domain-containing protein [Gordonia araii NBRC 100433]GAB11667.1 hypothetical protein GOARA_082_00560 [Gordonia araii NBRC 100433]